jgi:hypothetical protein
LFKPKSPSPSDSAAASTPPLNRTGLAKTEAAVEILVKISIFGIFHF